MTDERQAQTTPEAVETVFRKAANHICNRWALDDTYKLAIAGMLQENSARF